MEEKLLSKKELAERWNISISTLDRRIREKAISPALTKPIRFNLSDILKAEGTDASKLSPFERRRLERDIESLQKRILELEDENKSIKRQLTNVVAEIMPILKEA